jgi:8-oxo-dGTP pyrophosphatase MutT (NUDIX family)
MSVRDEGVFVVVLMKTNDQTPQVLLQIRKNTGLHDGEFVFPGGKREKNETWQDAAHRELYEETGLLVDKDRIQKLCQYGGRDQHGVQWLVMFYLCVIDSCWGTGLVKEPQKHSKVEWHSLYNLPKKTPLIIHKVLSDLRSLLADDSHGAKARSFVAAGLRNVISDIKKSMMSGVKKNMIVFL